MVEILVPRENVNDDSVLISVVHFKTGDFIKKGDLVVEIETSKTNIDIHSPSDGILNHQLIEHDHIKVGDVLFRVLSKSDQLQSKDIVEQEVLSVKDYDAEIKLSIDAAEIVRKLNFDKSKLKPGWYSSIDIKHLSMKENFDVSGSVNNLGLIGKSGNKILIYGGGGHAKMCIDILQLKKDYEIIGIVDSKLAIGSSVAGVEVLGRDDDATLLKLFNQGVRFAVNGVGATASLEPRNTIYSRLKSLGFYFPNIIHPSAIVESSVRLGEGNQIMMGACVGSAVVIKNNCIINSGSIISHDSFLNDNCHIAPGAILAGGVTVGSAAIVGMGVTVFMRVKIGDSAVLNNGVSVFSDVQSNVLIKR